MPVILSEAKDLGGGDPSPSARLRMTPYFFEIFAVANLVLIQALLWPIRAPLATLPTVLWVMGSGFLLQAAAGVIIRAVVAWRRGELRAYLAVIRSPRWISDTLRIALASALFIHAYAWIKLAIP